VSGARIVSNLRIRRNVGGSCLVLILGTSTRTHTHTHTHFPAEPEEDHF
jgi:hypothetical protein